MKFGNMNGAKGLNCPALSNESTRDGKNEIERAMTREWCFISPSRLDNKSRMRRESHVRFCEKWGGSSPCLLDLTIITLNPQTISGDLDLFTNGN